MNLTDDPEVPSFSTLLQLHNHNNNDNMTSLNINTLSQNNYMYNPVNTTTENYNYDTVSNNSSSTYTTFTDAPTHTPMYRPTSRASNNDGRLNESVQSLDLINKFKSLTLKNENLH